MYVDRYIRMGTHARDRYTTTLAHVGTGRELHARTQLELLTHAW